MLALFMAAAALAAPATCPYESPCVFLSPDVGSDPAPGTIVTYRGRGWAPGGRISAQYGSYCPPLPAGTICAGVGRGQLFRADRDGRFTFRLRAGTKPPPGPGPKGAGGEEVLFSGATPHGRGVSRYAVPPPPPRTRAERANARDVAEALRRLERSIARRQPITARTSDAQQAERERCRPLLDQVAKVGQRQKHVAYAVVSAAGDAATYGVDAAAFGTYATRLETLRLPPGRLADGAAAWIAAIRAPRYVPQPDVCAVLRRWRATGFARDAEPVAPDAIGLVEQLRADPRVRGGVDALRDLGVGRHEQELFSGDLLGLERYIDF